MASDRHQSRMLARAMKGDAESFTDLCHRYSDAIYRYLYFRLGSVFAAEEVCAEVFVRAWERLPSDQRQSVVPFSGWLFQIANDVIDERNRRFSRLGIHPTRPPLLAWSGSSKNGSPRLHPRFLAQAVMQLDPIAQQVILLRFVIRMSHRDTAVVIGDTGAGSRVLQYRGLLELREKLTRQKMSENAYASDYVGTASFCLDRIISGKWGPAECLEHLPQESDRLEQILHFAMLVREASNIRPRRSFDNDLRKQLLADIRQSKRRPVHQPQVWRWILTTSERIPAPFVAAFVLGFVLFVGVAGTTGIAKAVDHAAPGDRLYDLDLRLERAYRAFLSNPDSRLQFALDLTDERLAEAEMLAMRGDASGLQVALVAYSLEVASLVKEKTPTGISESTVDIDRHFSRQQQRLDKILVQALRASSSDGGSEAPIVICSLPADAPNGDFQLHPVGLTLAAQHDVDYGDVMNLVCNGHSFGEIVLALASVDSNAISTVDVLQMKSQLGGWGRLWQEMQLTGAVQPANVTTDEQEDDATIPAVTVTPSSTSDPQPFQTATPRRRIEGTSTPILIVTPQSTSTSEPSPSEDPGPPEWVDPPGGGPPDDPGPPDWVDPPGGGPPDDPGPPNGDDPPGGGPPDDPGPPDWVDPPGGGPPDDPGPPSGDDPPGNGGNGNQGNGNQGNGGRP